MKLFQLLVEGTRDKVFQKYVDLLAQRGVETTASQLKDYMRKKLTTEAGITALSLPSSYFLSGVTKLYFNGDLTTNKRLSVLYPKLNIKDKFDFIKCKKLNKIIISLRDLFIDSEGQKWEIPEDFGELSLDQIIKKYNKFLKGETFGDEKGIVEKKFDNTVGNYTFDILYDHSMAEKYGQYTIPYQWCITQSGNDYYFNKYQKENNTHFVVFKINGFDKVPQVVDEKTYPRDKYGTSLLAVQLKNNDGSFFCCTTRWNHGSFSSQLGAAPNIPNADFAVSWEEFQKITGCTEGKLKEIQKEWDEKRRKTNNTVKVKEDLIGLRKLKYASICINNGQNPVAPGHEMFSELTNVNGIKYNNEKWNKGIKMASIKDGYNKYSALLDNGKLKISTFNKNDFGTGASTIFDSLYRFTDYKKEKRDEYEDILSNFIFIPYSSRENNKFKLYNIKQHSIVSIAGKTLFDNVYGLLDYKYMFIKLGTKQYSIFNLETNKVLKADDGTEVFECVLCHSGSTYYTQIKDKYDIKRENLFLVGDSANHKCYIFELITKKIITPPTMNDGRILVPATSSILNPNSSFIVVAKNPVPKKIRGNDFSNIDNGTFLFSKKDKREISPFGLTNPLCCRYYEDFETIGYNLNYESWPRKWICYIKNTDKFIELKDGLHLFNTITAFGYFIDLRLDDGKSNYFGSKNIFIDKKNGMSLTKNGFSDNGEYDFVRSEWSFSDNIKEIVFSDGIRKLFSTEYKTFMRLENGEDSFKNISVLMRNSLVTVETTSGKMLEYKNKESFLSSLTPLAKINERFEKLANYKLIHF